MPGRSPKAREHETNSLSMISNSAQPWSLASRAAELDLMPDLIYRFDPEESKLAHDYLKHLATLNTGSLLLVVTFLDKLFDSPQWLFLAGAAIVCFLIGVAATVLAQAGVLENMHKKGEPWGVLAAAVGFLGAWGGLLAGLTSVVAFSLKNLY